MKGIQKFIKTNIKILLGIIIGVLISGSVVFAATIAIDAAQVTYNNSNTSLTSTNIKDALDELYTKSNSSYYLLKKYKTLSETPKYYACDNRNAPTTESPTTPPTCTTVYIGLYEDEQYGICIKKDGTQHCFRYNNWLVEKEHIKDVFPEGHCRYMYEQGKNIVRCSGGTFNCYVGADGSAYYLNISKFEGAILNSDGTLNCMSDC